METARTGRTRYLVVVSRPAKCRQPIPHQSITPSVCNTQNERQNSAPPSFGLDRQTTLLKKTHIVKHIDKKSEICKKKINTATSTATAASTTLVASAESDILRATNNCDTRSGSNSDIKMTRIKENLLNCDEFNFMNSINRNCNEVEESCLLGIDCNEKTTVGLVLRILADTSIRLDGDG